jgi:hypothetical protein
MGLYNFQARFVPFIQSGNKTHTIRSIRKNPDKPGNTLHLYTGLRTKKATRILPPVQCVKVEEIEIKDGIFGDENHASVCVDGIDLDRSERETLARRDGFPSFEAMIQFWRGRLPFRGHIIHWKRKD